MPLVTSIHRSLLGLGNQTVVKFVWVKAHCGIRGNEAADLYAKKAAVSHNRMVYNQFPLSYARREIRLELARTWETEYISAVQGSTTRQHLPTLQDVRLFRSAFDTSFEMTQILTGHSYARDYLFRFKISPTDVCPCDSNSRQTLQHLLIDCPRYLNSRFSHSILCTAFSIPPFDILKISKHQPLVTSFTSFVKTIISTLKSFNSLP